MTHFSTQRSWHRHFCGLEKSGRDLVLASGSFFNHDPYNHNTVYQEGRPRVRIWDKATLADRA